MTKKHKVFVSYYHDDDQNYKNKFTNLFANHYDILVSKSIKHGDIDPDDNKKTETIMGEIRDKYIQDSTVIVVLIGKHTLQRKFVDWEIYSGLRHTKNNPRCGLLGLLLPSHPDYGKDKYDGYTIPPRLYDNAKKGGVEFANIYDWTVKPKTIQTLIDTAYKRRNKLPAPDLSRKMFGKNHTGSKWQD